MMLHVGHHRKRARTALAAEPMPNLSLPASPLSPDAGDPYLPGSAGASECKSHELPALLPGMEPSYKVYMCEHIYTFEVLGEHSGMCKVILLTAHLHS